MHGTTHDTGSIDEEAALWWIILGQPDCTSADRLEFSKWISRSPERVEAFLWVATTHRALMSPRLHWPTTPAETLVHDAQDSKTITYPRGWAGRLTALEDHESASLWSVRSWKRWALASAACGLAVISLLLWIAVVRPLIPQDYQTGIGKQRSILLKDGTVMTLNTHSLVTVRFEAHERRVTLKEGEALFHVGKDPRRAFIVTTRAASIRDVGTEFNVRTGAARDVISVLQGKIEVASLPPPGGTDRALAAGYILIESGQQALVDRTGTRVQPIGDVSAVTAWTERRIVLDAQPLGDVAAEFNRYSTTHFVIITPTLAARRISGVFATDDSQSFDDFLRGLPNVRVRTLPNGDKEVEEVDHEPAVSR